ncbi:MAG: tetratricopeptide repeat protein, partial [Cyclobacteriaceae bacterium]|nr:tetratricopeptide repeat protein [Cyclobacteriaceae bacterium]
TSNHTAYDLYMKGREYYLRYNTLDNISAISLFKQALLLDSNFVMVHANLSDAYSQMVPKTYLKEDYLDSAYFQAEIARIKGPELSYGYKSMGLYYNTKGDIKSAADEYQKAIAIDNNMEAIINLSRINYNMGNLGEAYKLLEKIKNVSPLDAQLWYNYAAIYYRLNRFEKAKYYLSRVLSINPNHINALLLQWHIAILQKDEGQGLSTSSRLGLLNNGNNDFMFVQIQRALLKQPEDKKEKALLMEKYLNGTEINYINLPYLFNAISFLYLEGGLSLKADSLCYLKLNYNLEKIANGDLTYKHAYEIAQIYSIMGEEESAWDWLNKAYMLGCSEYEYLEADVLLDPVKKSDRFKNFVLSVRLRSDSLGLMIDN